MVNDINGRFARYGSDLLHPVDSLAFFSGSQPTAKKRFNTLTGLC
jgi:hypothetical protein